MTPELSLFNDKLPNKDNMKEDTTHLYRLKQSFDVILRKLETFAAANSDSVEHIKQAADKLSDYTRLFIDHFNEFKSIAPCARDELEKTLQESSEKMATAATKALIEKTRDMFAASTSGVAQNLNNEIQRLNIEIERHHRNIKSSYESSRKRHLQFVGAFCGGCVIVCVATIVLFEWHIEKSYSRTILKSASLGEALARAWPKLTKQEQDKILRYGHES